MEVVDVKETIANEAIIKSLDEYQKLYRHSIDNPEEFWSQQANRLTWFRRGDHICSQDFSTPNFSWFRNSTLNASYNCVDRHVVTTPDKSAIIWVKDEPGQYEHITYKALEEKVSQFANLLKRFNVRKGDRICIYMPMIPELAYAVLACARIGAIHSVVFAGFSAESLKDRIIDSGSKVLLTANEGRRGGKSIALKEICDDAIQDLPMVETVMVVKRTESVVPMQEGRDIDLNAHLEHERPYCAPTEMDAEDPLFILYTSGSTGKPKGLVHTTGGYMLYASMTHEYVFDLKPDDVYMCAADIGWVTGHSYIIYGPLANGATTVMFESTPTYPDSSRYWQVVEDLGVTQFYTAPTAIRAIAKDGNAMVEKHDIGTLRILGTVGEPINPEVWDWYHNVVGKSRCAIVDTWWQTETGGILITPLPGATPMKAGSATLPFFGVKPVLVNDDGKLLEETETKGNLCIAASWPGQARTIYGDHERFRETYFGPFKDLYFTGDGCTRDADGYYWITGRVDDVLNVSGHRLGTAEIESALVASGLVSEAAVVGIPHEIKGVGIMAYVQLNAAAQNSDATKLNQMLRDAVRKGIGPIASPDEIITVAGLPKTRSGKIMRRILRKIAEGEKENLGDITTLADPMVVEQIITQYEAQKTKPMSKQSA
ncbi:MAG: acetate--CoA ligase [Myxococcota bacterium]|nr:acetate--CoA ligase [Myxococcota bacterium]